MHLTTGSCALLLLLSWIPLALGVHALWPLIAGVVLLDVGAQGLHISNQSEIYRLRGEARSRLNSAYMTTYFAGGALGSLASAFAFGRWGWLGVCAIGGVFGLCATALWLGDARSRSVATPRSIPPGSR